MDFKTVGEKWELVFTLNRMGTSEFRLRISLHETQENLKSPRKR